MPGPPVANGAIQIRLPDASMRRELLALHLPNPERVKANLRFASGFLHCVANLAEQSRGLSGGDILNICLNAIHAGSRDPDPAKWMVTEEMLLREIKRAKAAKEKHSGRRGRGGGLDSTPGWFPHHSLGYLPTEGPGSEWVRSVLFPTLFRCGGEVI
jgi:hypothetical protein